jgi:hypothetical protein
MHVIDTAALDGDSETQLRTGIDECLRGQSNFGCLELASVRNFLNSARAITAFVMSLDEHSAEKVRYRFHRHVPFSDVAQSAYLVSDLMPGFATATTRPFLLLQNGYTKRVAWSSKIFYKKGAQKIS